MTTSTWLVEKEVTLQAASALGPDRIPVTAMTRGPNGGPGFLGSGDIVLTPTFEVKIEVDGLPPRFLHHHYNGKAFAIVSIAHYRQGVAPPAFVLAMRQAKIVSYYVQPQRKGRTTFVLSTDRKSVSHVVNHDLAVGQ